ncbi:hypothetical protein FHS85_004485 [Rhodoligotrophos appendicifer]|uniref:PDDEXK-like family protein n=1 Tax=Rhodoligotrophos appendicifer TaxID=987056 RepID=UPI0011852F9D|nr:PD-(D/E)XK nuclease family protein [Rhodoligotrophos appendicifer]
MNEESVGEQSLAVDIESKLADLIDDPSFHDLHNRMDKFNLFEAIGGVRAELRHSNFLGFLLSPARPHGLGSQILLGFLRGVIEKIHPHSRPVKTLELIVGDMDSAIVHRERANIDILIEIDDLKLVVLIENKIGANAGPGQLLHYRNLVAGMYRENTRFICIYLTPTGKASKEDGYVEFSYSELAQLIERNINTSSGTQAPSMSLILNHYVDMLRRNVVADEQLQEIARKLYDRHKEAIDFIIDNRPDDSVLAVLRPIIQLDSTLQQDRHGANILRFIPQEWDIPDLKRCDPEDWTRTGRNLLFEVKTAATGVYRNRVVVALVMGPSDQEFRKRLYNMALDTPGLFKRAVKPMGAKYASVYLRELLSTKAANEMDFDQMAETVQKNWADFVNSDLKLLTAAVLENISVR